MDVSLLVFSHLSFLFFQFNIKPCCCMFPALRYMGIVVLMNKSVTSQRGVHD